MSWQEIAVPLLLLLGCGLGGLGPDRTAPHADEAPSPRATAVETELERHVLGNGLTVLLEEDHWHPIAAIAVCYRVGSRDDPYGKQGLAHLLEHLTFRSPRGKAGEARLVAGSAAHAFATTDHDTTCFRHRLLREELDDALSAEAERMRTLTVSDGDLERERQVVIRERWELVEGDTWRNLLEEVDALAFRVHPYRFPTSGWRETLLNITPGDVRRHFVKYYSPANAVLTVVGDFDRDHVLRVIGDEFGRIPRREPPEERPVVPEPAFDRERRLLFEHRGRPRLVYAYHVPPSTGGDTAALEVLGALLAGSGPSLLGDVLYPDLAESVEVQLSRFHHDAGLFYIKASLGPSPNFERTGRAMDLALRFLRRSGPEPFELELAKKRVLLDRSLSRSHEVRAEALAQYTLLSALPAAERRLEEIEAVTEEDVRRVVGAYFSDDNRVIGMTGFARSRRRSGGGGEG